MKDVKKSIPVKECLICKRVLPLTDFKQHTTSADGHDYVCKPCGNLETQYRNMKSKYKDIYPEHVEYHKRLLKMYRRLVIGMTPREAAIDEVNEGKTKNEHIRTSNPR